MGMCGMCAGVCMGVHGCAWVCAGVRGFALLWVGVGGCAQVSVDMHGCVHVCGMNFQNFFRRIESLHQRTLIRILYEFLRKTLVEKEKGARSPKNVDIVSLSRRDSGCTGIMDHWPE